MEYKRPAFKKQVTKTSRKHEEKTVTSNVLTTDKESQKLFTVLCNYLSLAQFELARSVLDELFLLSPEKVAHVLRGLILADIPVSWLYSDAVPTGAHLAWLAFVEYTSLHQRIFDVITNDPLAQSQPDQHLWQDLAQRYARTPINPLGFVGHDRFQVDVLEAKSLKLFDRPEFAPGQARSYTVTVKFDGHPVEFRSNPSEPKLLSGSTDDPVWDFKQPGQIVFADSKIDFTVYAQRALSSDPDNVVDDKIGVCTLSVHQLRTKDEFHIWIPLDAPSPDVVAMANPFKLDANARNTGLSQVARPNFGRLRIRFSWLEYEGRVDPGRFPRQKFKALETDLLISSALYNGKKAYFAKLRGDPDAVPPGRAAAAEDGSRPMTLLSGSRPDESIDGAELRTNAPLLTETAVLKLRQYCMGLLSKGGPQNPLQELVSHGIHPEGHLPKEFWSQMRIIIRALPPAAHALTAQLHDLARESELNKKYNFELLAQPTAFQSLYATTIAENLLLREYDKAMGSVVTLTHEMYIYPKKSELMDDVFKGIISYIHNSFGERPDDPPSQKTLNELLQKYAKLSGISTRDLDIGNRQPKSLEMSVFSNTAIVRRFQDTVGMQAQAYASLLGTDKEFAIKRFNQLEDHYLYGGPDAKRQLPSCFLRFAKALEALDKLNLPPRELLEQQQQCLNAFYAEYYTFIRVTQQHVFQYVIRKALGYLKARNWKEASIAIRPFNQLRPLVILIAWDEFEDDFSAREEMITELWRNRPSFPLDQCAEPRLVQWCNRLDFNVRLIDVVLKHHSPSMRTSDRNDKALRLLDTLRLHSVLYAFRDFLPTLAPSVLLKLLDPRRQKMPQPNPGQAFSPLPVEPDRGAECDHDLHVLRSYYAIRSVVEIMLSDEPLEEWLPGQPTYSELVAGKDDDEKSAGVLPPTKLQAAQSYVMSMTKTDFQVTALEKVFCLLFMQSSDVGGKGANGAPNHGGDELEMPAASPLLVDTPKLRVLLAFVKDCIERVQANILALHQYNPQPRLMNNFARLAGLKLHVEEGWYRLGVIADMGLQPTMDMMVAPMESISTVFLKMDRLEDAKLKKKAAAAAPAPTAAAAPSASGASAPARASPTPGAAPGATVMNPPASASTQGSAASASQNALAAMQAQLKAGPAPVTPQAIALAAANNAGAPAASAAAVAVATPGAPPSAARPAAPAPVTAVTAVAATGAAPVGGAAQLQQVNVAEKWAELCQLVRERIRKKKDVVETVIEFVANYYSDPRATVPKGHGLDTTMSVMQGFFFAMDIAITFQHALSIKTSESLMDYAIAFLQATRPSHTEPEAIELYNFYLAYAKHCRANNRKRFHLASAFDASTLQRKGLEDEKEAMPEDPNALAQWVQAYRLSISAKQKKEMTAVGPSKLDVTSSWVTSLSGNPRDEIPARSYPAYITKYDEYCHLVGIAAISDNDVHAPEEEDRSVMDGERASPWKGTRVLDYLIKEAAQAVEEEQKDNAEQAQRMRLLAADPSAAPSATERLERVSRKMSYLGRKLLPSLGAVRYALRHAPAANIKQVAQIARAQAAILPAVARWVDWRAAVFENALKLLPRNSSGVSVLPRDVRDLLSKEDSAHDQMAYFQLLQRFLAQPNLSIGDKKLALSMADQMINANPETQAETEALIQKLLLDIIEDKQNEDQALRANCVMRLKDMQWAAQMCLKYVDQWDDPELAQAVCVKCLADLKPAHPLRPKIAFKYNIIHIFQGLTKSLPEEKAVEYVNFKLKYHKTFTQEDAVQVLRTLSSWRGLEEQCSADLGRVLLTLLDSKQVSAAQQLYEFYIKSKKSGDNSVPFQLVPQLEQKLNELIEAANISGHFTADSPIKDRIEGLKKIIAIEKKKRFAVARAILEHVSDPSARFAICEYLNRFVSETSPDGAAVEKLRSGSLSLTRSFHSLQSLPRASMRELLPLSDEERDWLHVSVISSRMLSLVPRDFLPQVAPLFRSPLKIMHRLLRAGRPEMAAKVMVAFRDYKGGEIRPDGSVTPPDSTPATVRAAEEDDTEEKVQEKGKGKRGAANTAEPMQVSPVAGVLPKPEDFNPYVFVLDFALEVLSLSYADLGKDMGFACLDLCTSDEQFVLTAHACLEIINSLSQKLGNHDHALFVVHLMKNVLVYFKAKLEPNLRPIDSPKQDTKESAEDFKLRRDRVRFHNATYRAVLARYERYRAMVFTADELAAIDQKPVRKSSDKDRQPLLYALRRVDFSIEDLLDPARATDLRERLINLDKLDLAKRVWVECEGRRPEEFQQDMKGKVGELRDILERFDAQPVASRRK